MIENKRFGLAYDHGDWWAVRDGDITLWKEEVVDLLNKLFDENQFLKNSETILNQKELQCLIYQTIINRYKAKIRDE